MKAVVTGGAGFIGSHLAEALLAQGAEVHVIDNLSSGDASHVPAGALLHRLDITDQETVEITRKIKPDIVFHQAAQVDVQHSVHDPGLDAAVNIAGTAVLMHACCQVSVKKVIYASSCAVYGDLDKALIGEDDPVNPISFYGLSKLTPEAYLQIFHRLYGLPYTILRYANVYGPRQMPKGEGGVVAISLERIKKGLPLIIYGDGEQTRDFVYVKDVVAANLAAMKNADGQTVQVGTASSNSLNRFVELLRSIHGCDIAAEYRQARSGDIRHSCLSNRKAFHVLGWKPAYNFYEGLKETYAYAMK